MTAPFYPPGYVPGWWRCPERARKRRWHDREQPDADDPLIQWEEAPLCPGCGTAMERVIQLERGARERTPGARVEVER